MLLDTEEDQWVFKRDPSIRGPLAKMGRRTSDGTPYLAPEIQLLYKARPQMQHKDRIDFDAAATLLEGPARDWLLRMFRTRFFEGHRWIAALDPHAGPEPGPA